MENHESNVIETTATEETSNTEKTSKFSKINTILRNRKVQIGAAVVVTAGVVAKIVIASRTNNEVDTEEV